MGWMVNLGKETLYPIYRRLGGSQGRSRRVRKISSATGIRSPDRPARSESLYRMSYWRISNFKQSLSTAQGSNDRGYNSTLGQSAWYLWWTVALVSQYHSTNAPYLPRLHVFVFRTSGRSLAAFKQSDIIPEENSCTASFPFIRVRLFIFFFLPLHYFLPLSVSALIFCIIGSFSVLSLSLLCLSSRKDVLYSPAQ